MYDQPIVIVIDFLVGSLNKCNSNHVFHCFILTLITVVDLNKLDTDTLDIQLSKIFNIF